MTIMDEMFTFRKNALLANLCDEWNSQWRACGNDKEKLTKLVLSQQAAPYFADFCYRGKGLTKEYCLDEFGEFINGRTFNDCDGVDGYTYGMFIDVPTDVVIGLDVAQFLWCSNTNIFIEKTKGTKLYISNKSDVHLSCDGYNSIVVMLFDESVVYLDDVDEESRITIYRYSKEAIVKEGKYCLSKNIKIFDKELRL